MERSETTFSVQFVPGVRLFVFDSAWKQGKERKATGKKGKRERERERDQLEEDLDGD